jgi:hypothetical protein
MGNEVSDSTKSKVGKYEIVIGISDLRNRNPTREELELLTRLTADPLVTESTSYQEKSKVPDWLWPEIERPTKEEFEELPVWLVEKVDTLLRTGCKSFSYIVERIYSENSDYFSSLSYLERERIEKGIKRYVDNFNGPWWKI